MNSTTVGRSPTDRLAASLGSAGPGPSNQVPADSAGAGSGRTGSGSAGSGSGSGSAGWSWPNHASSDSASAGSRSASPELGGSGSARSGSARSGSAGSASSNHARADSVTAGWRRAGSRGAESVPRNSAPLGSAPGSSQTTPDSCQTCCANCQPERWFGSSSPATAPGGTAIPGPPARPRNASVGPTTGICRDPFWNDHGQSAPTGCSEVGCGSVYQAPFGSSPFASASSVPAAADVSSERTGSIPCRNGGAASPSAGRSQPAGLAAPGLFGRALASPDSGAIRFLPPLAPSYPAML